jgi:hypothetical protein
MLLFTIFEGILQLYDEDGFLPKHGQLTAQKQLAQRKDQNDKVQMTDRKQELGELLSQ